MAANIILPYDHLLKDGSGKKITITLGKAMDLADLYYAMQKEGKTDEQIKEKLLENI